MIAIKGINNALKSLLFILILTPGISLLAGTIGILEFLKISLLIVFSYSLGNIILSKLLIYDQLEVVSRSFLASFIGLFCFSFALFLPYRDVIVILGGLISIFINIKYFSSSPENSFKKSILLLIVVLVCLIPFYNYNELLIRLINKLPEFPLNLPVWVDPDFFVAQVASLRKGTINDAIYQSDTPLDYQFGGYLPAALIAEFAGTSSQVGLYGIWITICNLLQFLLIAEIVKAYNKNLFVAAVTGLLAHILLIPWHYKTFFLEMPPPESNIGFLGPNQSASFCCSIPLALIVLLWVFEYTKTRFKLNLLQGCFLIACLSLVAAAKLALFAVLGILIGSIALYELYSARNFRFFIYVLLGGICGVIAYSICFSSAASVITIKPGYYINFINTFSGVNAHNKLVPVLVLAVLMVVWGGASWLAFIILWADKAYRHYILALGLMLLGTAILINLVSITLIWPDLGITIDGSFNLAQFLRCAFFIFKIALLPFLVSVLYTGSYKYICYALCAYAICVVLGYFNKFSAEPRINFKIKETAWLSEVRQEIADNNSNSMLLAINPDAHYYSSKIGASDVGNFYVSYNYLNYNCSLKHADRWTLFKKLFRGDKNEIRLVKEEFQKNKVAFVIACPGDIENYNSLEKKGIVSRIAGTKWLYTINDI